ncbi:RHS repeat-associated core domain-containing protein [Actinoplanes sp. NPDC024001]|uniref:RHS repeat-associated core domain-containing protein n=1 Tax=Actinoplanes sp. NPDC024001 TaxID=3154598 RepID=UPI0033D85D21
MTHAHFRLDRPFNKRWTVAVALAVTVAGVPLTARPAAAAPTPAPGTPAGAPATPTAPDCSLAAQPDEARASAAAKACGKAVENEAARTETQSVHANPDGSWTATVAAGQLRTRNAAGDLVPIDLNLHTRADGSVEPAAHPGGLRLSGAAGAGEHELLSITADRKRISMGWTGALPAPELVANTAKYANVRPGVDLVVTATRTGVEQVLVVNNREAAKQVADIKLPLKTDDLTMAGDGNGGTVFRNGKGAVVATSPTPEMWDATVDATGRPAKVLAVDTVRTKRSAESADLTLTPSKSFLDDPKTVYPVTIDPSINPLYDSFDTYVKENDAADRSGSDTLMLGYVSGADAGVARSFLHWPVSTLKGKKVTSASVKFWNYYSGTCTARQWELWSTGAASTASRWANQPAWLTREATSTQTAGYSSACADNWVSVSASSFFDRAAAAQQDTAYMGLRATTEGTDVTFLKQLRSNRSDNADHIPTASVTYTSYPNALDPLKLQPGDAAETETRTPVMKGVFSDPDGGTGRVDFEVYDRTGATLIASGSGATVNHGSESSWTAPSGKLNANTTYKWRARGHDGSVGGPWSVWRFMTTSDGSPTGEQGRFSFQEQKLTDRLELKVNVANGNLLLKNTDLQIRGTGSDFTLERYYNSRSTTTTPLGKGWTLGTAHDVKVTYSKSDHATADVTYHAPTGFTAKFINSGTNAWRTPPSLDAKLTRNTSTGELRLKFDKSEASFYFADSTGRLLRSQDKNNNKITFGYDGNGCATTITDTQGRVTTLTYVSSGLARTTPDSYRLTSVTDSTGRKTSYTYNAAKNLETVTDAAGGVTRFEYGSDRLAKVTTPEGRVVNLGYEPDTSRMLDFYEQTNPGGSPDTARWTFTYSANKTEVTDPNGSATSSTTDGITTHDYEERDRVTKVKDPLGHSQDKKYNANDNIELLTDALTNATTFGWDPNTNNLTSVGIATGAKSNLAYGNTTHPNSVSTATDPQGNTMSYSYDAAGNKTAEESSQYPGQKIFEAEHNDNGTVKWRDDAKDVRTNFTYDAKGNLTKVDNPAPLGDITMAIDTLSRMVENTDGKGNKTQYTYDKLDRIDKITFQGGNVVDYTYDRDGHLVQLTDPTGTTTFTYDRFGRPTGKQVPGAAAIRYEYDRNGNLTKYTDGGGAVTYAYNAANLVTSLQEPGASGPVTFTYDDNNRRTNMYLPTNPRITVAMKYDKSGRQTSIIATNDATGAKLTSFTYDYTKAGADSALRHSMTDLSGTTSYTYDKLNRLTAASGPGLSRSYAYDANYNRTSKTEGGTTTSYSYNDAHQLTGSGSTTYSFDANGNLTSSNNGWAITYNTISDQTVNVTAPGKSLHGPLTYGGVSQTERRRAGSVSYTSSALGTASATRPATTGASTMTTIDPNAMEPPHGTSDYYTRDNSGNLIGLRANGVRYYYLVDGLGSVVGVVNTSGAKVNSYSYDPYGNQLSASQQIHNPWRYAGGFFDSFTGLTKYGARYYDPGLGRFTQRDPSGKDLPYAYAKSDPVNNSDPTGLLTESAAFEFCFLVCGSLGYAEDDQGNSGWNWSVGVGIGTGPGINYTAQPGDLEKGLGASGSCAAGPAGVSVSEDLEGNDTYGYAASTGAGCSLGIQGQH